MGNWLVSTWNYRDNQFHSFHCHHMRRRICPKLHHCHRCRCSSLDWFPNPKKWLKLKSYDFFSYLALAHRVWAVITTIQAPNFTGTIWNFYSKFTIQTNSYIIMIVILIWYIFHSPFKHFVSSRMQALIQFTSFSQPRMHSNWACSHLSVQIRFNSGTLKIFVDFL